ncbi:Conserved putative membrane protein [Klebsiella pneumoniae]|uniref:diguanylate cyclase n=1 Tax=Raoultella ornithinolytica TaxID=54291 RepID=A0A2H4ZGP5_RAOOR|nr:MULTISPECIES: EAL domain-containing protein [Klebsiella/Raoultella group]AUF80377.1 Diguanylate cyclase/phosphodiesterase [Raoultella ornithinolytica]MCZ0104117.1 EAL domain-containing protein [Raoultella ornithinolytica]SWY14777.1 Conserved putative membrane protein [Klebsiella pneumoniae]HAV2048844.1 EAL domain-containing protein [Raoultella ornithinolytica]HAV2054474.1 EAL domain-containing protein [Raoultella ornithinolytica]
MSARYRAAVDAAAIFSETDKSGIITYVNEQFCDISGYSAQELIGQNHRILNSGQHPPEFFIDMWKKVSRGQVWKGEICNRKKDGSLYWVESTIVPMYDDASQRVQKYVSIRFDVTEKRKFLETLQWHAEHDELTGLPNRFLLSKALDQAIVKAKSQPSTVAVGVLDLDGFKQINDRYGHEIGDRLLVAVADRLKHSMRIEDTVARLGGDEFVLILGVRDPKVLESALQRLLAALSAVYIIDGIGINISASIGVTLYPNDNENADTLLRHADQAMYKAKQSGRNCFHLFDVSKDKMDKSAFDTVIRVRQALHDGELCLHYQPKISLSSGAVIGFEALLRWQHPRDGLILPQYFIPLIGQSDLIVEIGEWVIDQALSQIEQWADLGHSWSVSVNIAALHLKKENFVKSLKFLLDSHPNVLPQMLDIEITESVVIEHLPHVTQCLIACQDLGVTFSLDDFGTGYSSLSYLKQLPTQSIKIDKSFIRDILIDKDSLGLTKAIIGLAKSFNREVIAEGVETVEHEVLLMNLGCDVAQGYGIAKPMPVEKVLSWVAKFVPAHLSRGGNR